MSAVLPPEEDVQVEPDNEGLTAHPPGPHIVFETPKPPTPTEMVRAMAYWFASNIAGLLIVSAIVSYAWNAIESLHTLPTINFQQAFALMVIVRVLALTVRS